MTTLRTDLALIAAHVAPGTRVLDVGCGDGTLLAALRGARAPERAWVQGRPPRPRGHTCRSARRVGPLQRCLGVWGVSRGLELTGRAAPLHRLGTAHTKQPPRTVGDGEKVAGLGHGIVQDVQERVARIDRVAGQLGGRGGGGKWVRRRAPHASRGGRRRAGRQDPKAPARVSFNPVPGTPRPAPAPTAPRPPTDILRRPAASRTVTPISSIGGPDGATWAAR